MKIITVPKDLEVEINREKKPLTFREFLFNHLDYYAECKTPKMVRQVVKVGHAIDEMKDTLVLENEDCALLQAACTAVKYLPVMAKQLTLYWDAVEKAEEVKK